MKAKACKYQIGDRVVCIPGYSDNGETSGGAGYEEGRDFVINQISFYEGKNVLWERNAVRGVFEYAVELADPLNEILAAISAEIKGQKKTSKRKKAKGYQFDPKEFFNPAELGHLAVNFSISCMKGYNNSFDEWYGNLSSDWRKIANR